MLGTPLQALPMSYTGNYRLLTPKAAEYLCDLRFLIFDIKEQNCPSLGSSFRAASVRD